MLLKLIKILLHCHLCIFHSIILESSNYGLAVSVSDYSIDLLKQESTCSKVPGKLSKMEYFYCDKRGQFLRIEANYTSPIALDLHEVKISGQKLGNIIPSL